MPGGVPWSVYVKTVPLQIVFWPFGPWSTEQFTFAVQPEDKSEAAKTTVNHIGEDPTHFAMATGLARGRLNLDGEKVSMRSARVPARCRRGTKGAPAKR